MLKNGGTSHVRFSKDVMELNEAFQPYCIDIWYKQYNPVWENVKTVPNVQAPFEGKNDFSLYEEMFLVPQLYGRREQIEADELLDKMLDVYYLHETKKGRGRYILDCKKGAKFEEYDHRTMRNTIANKADLAAKEKETFIEYLKLRSKYKEEGNEFDLVRSEMLKNPSEDVVDAEILRLMIIANNTRQFLFSEDEIVSAGNHEKVVKPLLYGNAIAKMLEEFTPQKEPETETEKKYFSYMNKLGEFWHKRLKGEAEEKLTNLPDVIDNFWRKFKEGKTKEDADKIYYDLYEYEQNRIPFCDMSDIGEEREKYIPFNIIMSKALKQIYNEKYKKEKIIQHKGQNLNINSLTYDIENIFIYFSNLSFYLLKEKKLGEIIDCIDNIKRLKPKVIV